MGFVFNLRLINFKKFGDYKNFLKNPFASQFILVPVAHRDKYRVLKLTYELASSLHEINFIVTGTSAQEFIANFSIMF
jgi:hypothetical protein